MQLAYDAVIYCDPPYIPVSDALISRPTASHFTPGDHRDLVATLINAHRQYGTRAVISNSDTPETHDIYSAFNLRLQRTPFCELKSRDMAGGVIGVLRISRKLKEVA